LPKEDTTPPVTNMNFVLTAAMRPFQCARCFR